MKKSKVILFPLLAAFTIVTSISCNNSDNNVIETQQTRFTITTKNSDLFAGSATELNGVKYDEGATVRLIATANYGYSFLGWYDGNTLITAETEYLLKLESNLELTAKWKKEFQTYALNTINTNSNAGNITVHEDSRIKENTNVTLRAIPKENYKFIGWYEGDTLLSQDSTYTFVIDHNTVIQAKWETLSTFIINTINDNPLAGTITSFTNQIFKKSDEITLEALPATGYVFDGWYNGDTLVSTFATYKFYPDSDLTLTAKWATSCTLTTISDNNNGYVTPYSNKSFEIGSSVTLEASGYPGYLFNGWYNGDTLVSDSSTYTFTIDSNLELTAKWKVNSNIAYRQDQFTFENDSYQSMTGIIDKNVTEIVIPEGTEGVFEDVFNYENNITSVTFPKTLEWLAGDTFAKNGEIDFYYDGDWFTFNNIYRSNADDMPYNHGGGNIYFLDENGSVLHNGKRYSLQKDIILPEGINNLVSGLFRGFNKVESLYIPASVTAFNGGWQFFNSSFKKIYYGGTQEAWNNINKDEENSNKALKDMTIYFYSEDTPSTDGNYWHYVDGIITIWE